jgi:hypothetical protein
MTNTKEKSKVDETKITFRFIKPIELLKIHPNAECYNCGAEPDSASND